MPSYQPDVVRLQALALLGWLRVHFRLFTIICVHEMWTWNSKHRSWRSFSLKTAETCEVYQLEMSRWSIPLSVIMVTGHRSSWAGQGKDTNTPGGRGFCVFVFSRDDFRGGVSLKTDGGCQPTPALATSVRDLRCLEPKHTLHITVYYQEWRPSWWWSLTPRKGIRAKEVERKGEKGKWRVSGRQAPHYASCQSNGHPKMLRPTATWDHSLKVTEHKLVLQEAPQRSEVMVRH